MQTTFSAEEVLAVEAGLAALKGEQATLNRWGAHSLELALHIDDLELLRDRLRGTQKRLRESFMSLPDYPVRYGDEDDQGAMNTPASVIDQMERESRG